MQERMRISSVNIGAAEKIDHAGKSMTTGICKRPVAGAIRVTEQGLEGDSIVDQKHHGGDDQEIYAYSQDDYCWWKEAAGREFPAGLFGENLTIDGLPSNLFNGDRLLVCEVVLEATSARIPCGPLATRMEDPGFGLAFRQAARHGTYFRVLNSGTVQAGDSVTLVETAGGAVTVLDLFRFAYETSHDAERLQRFLAAPIAARVRSQVEAALAKI